MFVHAPPSSLRLRERTAQLGAHSLGDLELLAAVLGTGAGGASALRIAANLLDAGGSLEGLTRIGAEDLALVRGVGPAKAVRVLCSFELGARALTRRLSADHDVVGSFASVAEWARPRLAGLDHEEVWTLVLDAKNGLRAALQVGRGGLHGCALLPRDVLRPAIQHGGSTMVLVHNHPSGDPTPSPEDIAMTRAVAHAADIVGVPLLDHVVVARRGAASVCEAER